MRYPFLAVLTLVLMSGCTTSNQAQTPSNQVETTSNSSNSISPADPQDLAWHNSTFAGNLGLAPCIRPATGNCLGPVAVTSKESYNTQVNGTIVSGRALLTWTASSPAMENLTFYAGPIVPCPDRPDLSDYCFSAAGNVTWTSGKTPLELNLDNMTVADNAVVGVWVRTTYVTGPGGVAAKPQLPQDFQVAVTALVRQ